MRIIPTVNYLYTIAEPTINHVLILDTYIYVIVKTFIRKNAVLIIIEINSNFGSSN